MGIFSLLRFSVTVPPDQLTLSASISTWIFLSSRTSGGPWRSWLPVVESALRHCGWTLGPALCPGEVTMWPQISACFAAGTPTCSNRHLCQVECPPWGLWEQAEDGVKGWSCDNRSPNLLSPTATLPYSENKLWALHHPTQLMFIPELWGNFRKLQVLDVTPIWHWGSRAHMPFTSLELW